MQSVIVKHLFCWAGVWLASTAVLALADQLVNYVQGCNNVEAVYWSVGQDECGAFTGKTAYVLMLVTQNLKGSPIPTTKPKISQYQCRSCPEVCNNNPLDPSRELKKPDDFKQAGCTFVQAINPTECSECCYGS